MIGSKNMLILAASTALVASVGSARAADPVYDMAPDVPAIDWTGFWLGAQVGYMFGEVDIEAPVVVPPSFDVDGFYLGASAGYDIQLDNNIVVGAFLTAPIAAFSDGNGTGGATGYNGEVNWALAAGLRIGFAVDRWLPYIMGGGVIGEGEGTNVGTGATDTQTHTGYFVGAGFDYLVTDNWTVGAYYSYQDLGSQTYQINPATIDFDTHAVALTVGYRF